MITLLIILFCRLRGSASPAGRIPSRLRGGLSKFRSDFPHACQGLGRRRLDAALGLRDDLLAFSSQRVQELADPADDAVGHAGGQGEKLPGRDGNRYP